MVRRRRRERDGDLAQWRLDEKRERGLRAGLYYTGGMDWLVNPERIDTAQKIYSTILDAPEHAAYADAHWRELIPHRAGVYVLGMELYAGHLVRLERANL